MSAKSANLNCTKAEGNEKVTVWGHFMTSYLACIPPAPTSRTLDRCTPLLSTALHALWSARLIPRDTGFLLYPQLRMSATIYAILLLSEVKIDCFKLPKRHLHYFLFHREILCTVIEYKLKSRPWKCKRIYATLGELHNQIVTLHGKESMARCPTKPLE